jgi:putative peptidoglycan lipid II flippase
MFADAFFVAFRIPNLLRSFVAEGALTAAFVPVFSASLAKGKSEAAETFRRVGGFLLLVTIPLSALTILYAGPVLSAFAPGFSDEPEKFSLSVELTRIMMPYIVCISLIAMLNSALNALGVFGTSAWAQVIMNLTLIGGALAAMPFGQHTATLILAWSVLLGGVTQLIAQVPACRRAGLPFAPSMSVRSRDIADLLKLMLPATVGASIYQVTIFLATLLASSLREGSVSWLFYADRVAQFPLGIFSVALASVLLPALSNASATADSDKFRTTLADSLRYTSFIIIPMAAGIWALALPVTRVLFERGAFSLESSVMTSRALQALSLGLWFTSCHSMIVRAFIARKDTITPTVIGVCTLTVNFSVSLFVMGPVSPATDSTALRAISRLQSLVYGVFPVHPELGHVGLALASSVAAFTSLLMVLWLFSRKIGAFPWGTFLASTGKALLGAIVMVVLLKILESYVSSPRILCVLGALAGAVAYASVSFVIRSREMRETIAIGQRLVRRFRGKS